MTARAACLLALLAAALLTACGGEDPPAAGSPERPLAAKTTPGEPGAAPAGSGAQKPGYDALVERQSSKPRSRFTPCNLVTRAQARAILGAPVLAPVEAGQGPTCIYRTREGGFVSVAVQRTPFERIEPRLRQRRRVDVAGRAAYCGTYGQPMLYVPLARGRVLSIAGRCDVARGFAAKAVRQF